MRFFILFFLINCNLFFGQELKGRVFYYETKGIPASGIKVSALGCTPSYSVEDGTFSLNCQNKEAGQAIRLFIEPYDADGKAIEFVNQDQYEYLALPLDPDIYFYEIYVAPLGTANRRKEEIYHQIVKKEVKPIIDKVSLLENRLDIVQLESEKKQIEEELINTKRKLQESELNAERLAEQISMIDRTRVSSLVKDAIASIDSGMDIDTAIKIISNEAIIDSYNNEKKLHNSNINEIIQACSLDRAVNVYHLRRMKVSSANQVHEIDSFWC